MKANHNWVLSSPILLGFIAVTFSLAGCDKAEPVLPKTEQVIKIDLIHSPEVTSYLSTMMEQYLDTTPKLPDGQKIQVSLENMPGLTAAEKISSGEKKISAWLAPSSSYVALANNKRRNLGPRQIECQQLFATPVVFAIHPDYAPFVESEQGSFSWRNFYRNRLAPLLEPGAEALRPVSLSHGNVLLSDTGFSSLAQLAYLSNRGEGLISAESLTGSGLLDELRTVESFVSHYSTRDWLLLGRIAQSSISHPHLTVTTEQRLAIFNALRRAEGGNPLLAVYPEEGSYWQDYTLCTSDADWVTPAHRAAIRQILNFLSTDDAQLSATRKGFRPSIVPFRETDPLIPENGISAKLPTKSFTPLTPDMLEELLKNWQSLMRPNAVLFVVDTSGSMEGEPLRNAKEQIRNVIAHMQPNDLKALVTFQSTPKLAVDFTTDGGAVIKSLDSSQSIGGSAVNDALNFSLDLMLRDDMTKWRKTIVMITDGDDKNSQVSLSSIIERSSDVAGRLNISLMLYGLGYGDVDFSGLSRIAKGAHGIYRQTSVNDMEAAFEELMENL
jgi:Ca-activated chloride channel family protein